MLSHVFMNWCIKFCTSLDAWVSWVFFLFLCKEYYHIYAETRLIIYFCLSVIEIIIVSFRWRKSISLVWKNLKMFLEHEIKWISMACERKDESPEARGITYKIEKIKKSDKELQLGWDHCLTRFLSKTQPTSLPATWRSNHMPYKVSKASLALQKHN